MTDVAEWPGQAPQAEWDDISWRIDSKAYQSKKAESGYVARWVPYLNATTVARLLDEWVGPTAWFDEYHPVQVAGGQGVECELTFMTPPNEDNLSFTITKRDVGVSPGGNEELSVKGIYSDAFKRVAIIKWGVGRNVYAMDSVYAPVGVRERQGKQVPVEIPESWDVLEELYREATEREGTGE